MNITSEDNDIEEVFISPISSLVEIQCPFSKKELEYMLVLLRTVAREYNYKVGTVTLCLMDDWSLAQLNWRNLGLKGPTNVLSYPYTSYMPGDIAISLDTLERECKLYNKYPRDHFITLLAHGFAHLVGLDHGPEMEKLEQTFYNAVVFGIVRYYDG